MRASHDAERASLVVELRLESTRTSVVATDGLHGTGSVVVAHRLSCPVTCGIFLDQGLEPVSPALSGRIFATGPPEKSLEVYSSYTPFLEGF